jgi:hypothetical protein
MGDLVPVPPVRLHVQLTRRSQRDPAFVGSKERANPDAARDAAAKGLMLVLRRNCD